MTAPPQVITRSLTFHFAPSVSSVTGLPEILELAIIPLEDASSSQAGGTFVGGVKTATVELVAPGPNLASFDLIPSYSPGLSGPINYRVMWRTGVMGRTFTYDFVMPDADVTWEQVVSQDLVIDGEVYLQHSDLGVPGRVARLDDEGIPAESSGRRVATLDDIQILTNELNVETVTRSQADSALRTDVLGQMANQDTATLNTAKAYTDTKTATLTTNLGTEHNQRIAADTNLADQITTLDGLLQAQIDTLGTTVAGHTAALPTKADLVGGFLPISQVPPEAITSAVAVPDQAAMLALTTVQKGDLAIRPDGIWLLNGANPATLSNWVSLTAVGSVNGKKGTVVLTATDVGAIPVGGAVDMNQVTGLNTALLGKTNVATTTALQSQVTALANDPTIVKTVSGTIPLTPMPPEIALVNSSGQVTNKAGQVVASGGSGGAGAVLSVNTKTGNVVLNLNDVKGSGSIAQSQVDGLSTSLAGKASTTDTRFSDARTPTAHAASHGVGQSDAITVAQSQVTGLSTILTNNNLTTTSNFGNRINALEAGGGGGGGGGSPVKSTWWDSPSDTTDFSTVVLKSPFGKAIGDGHLYYDPDGAAEAEAVYPHITPNGHLELRVRNESNPADPVLAKQSDLDATNTTVASKANSSALAALSTTVDTKAASADLAALTTTVGTKANQSALDSTNATVATKANQSALDTLITTVGGISTALTHKADLDGSNKVLLAQVPTLPISQTTNLQTSLDGKASTSALASLTTTVNGKADLSGPGTTVPLTQLPAYPTSKVTGLDTALSGKADLVGGSVPLAQIPPGAITSAVQVANKTAMLALTSAQVQPGDICVITATVDQGSYLLTNTDPSNLANWQPLSGASAPVVSVNTKVGEVVLTWTDVGAMAANAAIPISQVTNLSTQLDGKATTTALTTGLAGKTSPADVQNMFYLSSMVKRADYVATASVASRAGRQSADGVLMPLGALVLLTAQPSSVDNGIWVVNTGAWTRPADFATASFLARDTMVVVNNQTASANGSANSNTIWQMTVNSGFIGTDANNWTRFGWTSPPLAPVEGNGIDITGTYPALTFAAQVDPGKGLVLTASGLATDTNKTPGKFIGPVPAGNKIAGITHNLNTTSPVVQVWDVGSNQMVLAGVTVTGPNAISVEFASVPASGDYRVVVLG